ncbi:MAG: hypothetical protein ACLP1X_19435 [Polyangiaceae bacterium]
MQTRSQYLTTIRGLARAVGLVSPKSATGSFVEKVASSTMDEELRALIAPMGAHTIGEETVAEKASDLAMCKCVAAGGATQLRSPRFLPESIVRFMRRSVRSALAPRAGTLGDDVCLG